ncbi:MAG: dihydrofolate reductase family protein [Chloroflexota bacterium]|nr:MAG: deaminase [Chloroflexota bacterium]
MTTQPSPAPQSQRNVIFSMLVSLDGYIEGPKRELDWPIIDEEFHTFVNEREAALGTFLYGRRLYKLMSDFWPTADQDPTQPEYIHAYSRIWKEMPKIVFSKTLDKVDWNARLASSDLVEEVTRLKAQPGKNISVGGAELAASLMRLGLIDEYELYIQPILLGSGTRMFPELQNRTNLRLIETRSFGSGVVYLRYQRANV